MQRADRRSTSTPVLALLLPALALAAWLLVPIVVRLVQAPTGWNLFSDRDLIRASGLFDEIPASGAEFSGGRGGRIPGGLQYVLIAAALAVHDDPETVQRLVYLLDTAALGVLAWGASRAVGGGARGVLAGAAAAAIALGSTVAVDAIGQVWNPAWMPLFVAIAVVAAHRVGAGHPRSLVVFAVAVACAGQMHMMALAWGAAAAIALAVARPGGLLRVLPAAVVGFVVPYVPYVIDEARHGWTNTRRLLTEPYVRMLGTRPPKLDRVDDVGLVASLLAGHLPAAGVGSVLGFVRWTALAGFAIGLVVAVRRRAEPDARATLVVAASVLLTGAGLLFESPSLEERYVAVLVPGTALVAALGLVAVVDAAARRGAAVGGLVATVLAVAVAVPTTWWLDRGHGSAWRLDRTLDSLREKAGYDASDVAARAIFVADVEGRPGFRPLFAFDDVLRRHGSTWPGSATPPCVAVADRPIDAALLSTVLAGTGANPRVLDAWTEAPTSFALYDPGLPRCPVSAVNRYVDTPAETTLLPLLSGSGGVRRIPIPGGERFGVAVPIAWRGHPDRLVVGVDLVVDGPELVVTLHGNALRGEPANVPWGLDAVVSRPRITLTPSDGAPLEVVIAEGRVGGKRAATPVSARVRRPSGPVDVTLHLDVVRGTGPKATGTPGTIEAHEVPLVQGWNAEQASR